LQNIVPNSDISTTSSQITWPKPLKLSQLIRLWRHHKQRDENIQGYSDTKVSRTSTCMD